MKITRLHTVAPRRDTHTDPEVESHVGWGKLIKLYQASQVGAQHAAPLRAPLHADDPQNILRAARAARHDAGLEAGRDLSPIKDPEAKKLIAEVFKSADEYRKTKYFREKILEPLMDIKSSAKSRKKGAIS